MRGRRGRNEDQTGGTSITRAKEKRKGALSEAVRERSLSPDAKQSLKERQRSLSPGSKSAKGVSTVPPSPIVQPLVMGVPRYLVTVRSNPKCRP